MTDEERQKLCFNLRNYLSPATCELAADEIERLAEENKELKGKLDYASRLDEADD